MLTEFCLSFQLVDAHFESATIPAPKEGSKTLAAVIPASVKDPMPGPHKNGGNVTTYGCSITPRLVAK